MSGPEKALKPTCTCKLNSTSLERKPAACAVPLFRFLQVTGGTLFSVLYAGVCATPRASPPSAPCCATQQTPAAWRQTAAPRPPLSHSPLRSQDPPWPHPSATSPQWPRPVPTPPSPPSTPLGCLGSVSALFWPDSQRWVGYFYTLGNKGGGGGYIRIAVCLSAVGVGVGYFYTLGNRLGGGVYIRIAVCLSAVGVGVGYFYTLGNRLGGWGYIRIAVCLLLVWGWVIFIPWVTEMGGGGLYQNCCLSVHPSICLCIQLCSRRCLLTYKPFVTKLVFWEGGWRWRYCVCACLNTYYLHVCVCVRSKRERVEKDTDG